MSLGCYVIYLHILKELSRIVTLKELVSFVTIHLCKYLMSHKLQLAIGQSQSHGRLLILLLVLKTSSRAATAIDKISC